MKDIKGYEGLYAVTKDGKIWCYAKKWKITRGGFCKRKAYFINTYRKGRLYPQINLCRDNKCTTYWVHRIVAQTYIPNPDNLPEVNHKNGIKNDNRVENLEWVTHQQNMQHAYTAGLRKVTARMLENMTGINNNSAKLTEQDVREIREKYKQGLSQRKISVDYSVAKSTVQRIVTGEGWKHVS